MTDTTAPTDSELIHGTASSLAALHAIVDVGTNQALKDALSAHHANLEACLARYNEAYAPEGQTVTVARSGGGKPD